MKRKINICLVTKKNNKKIIEINIKEFNKIYNNSELFFNIICPEKDKSVFKKIKNKHVKIISENAIIKYDFFEKVFLTYFKKTKYYNKIKNRINWYYQQCLKIIFLETHKKYLNLIWDADTLIINKIEFFNNDFTKPINYENYYEMHTPYFLTNKIILKKLPKNFYSGINQFIAMTEKEILNFKKKLKFFLKKKDFKSLVPHVMAKSIKAAHKYYDQSLFSEYELFNHCRRLDNQKFKSIRFYRTSENYIFNSNQLKLLRILNYKHITFENHYNLLEKKISWFNFILKLIFLEFATYKNFFKFKIKSNLIYYL